MAAELGAPHGRSWFRPADRLLAIGIATGLALAVVGTRLLGSLLFEVGPLDLLTFVIATATLGSVAVGAIAIPAVRASHVAPTEALRAD